MLIASIEPHATEFDYDDFSYDIKNHFTKHLGKQVFVSGENIGWRNLSATMEFTLQDCDDIFRKITPERCDFSLEIRDTDRDNVYEAVCYHHDSPTGEFFNLTIQGK
tara:strand:+ start:129 stop:449 length:321 start_codon:yes stop_codon:yes gene_type:complete